MRQVSEARAVAALTVRETEGLLLVDLGKQINQDVSSLSQSARKIAFRMKEDALLAERLGFNFPIVKPDPRAQRISVSANSMYRNRARCAALSRQRLLYAF